MFAVIEGIVHLIFVGTVPQLIRHNRIEIGCVRGIANFWYIGCRFVSKTAFEVHAIKERVRLQFVRTAPASALISRGAKAGN